MIEPDVKVRQSDAEVCVLYHKTILQYVHLLEETCFFTLQHADAETRMLTLCSLP